MSGELMMTRFDTRVEKPGARQDCAMKPSFSSFRHTAWSSRRQSHPAAIPGCQIYDFVRGKLTSS